MKTILIILALTFNGICNAQEVVDVKMSTCDMNSNPEYMHRNRLISSVYSNDTLFLRLGIVQNCGFEPKINCILRNDTLDFSFQNISEIYVACDCCFELDLKITGLTNDDLVFVNGISEIKELKNKYIFPNLTEIANNLKSNDYNADHLKIGLWEIDGKGENKTKWKVLYFIDEDGESRSKWRVGYNKKGEIIQVCALTYVDSEGISNMTCIEGYQYLELMKNEP